MDPEEKAKESIDGLTMKDMQKILKYNIKFTCHSIKLEWPDNILYFKYYKDLTLWIKNAYEAMLYSNQY